MTDKTRQDSGSTHIIRFALELGLLWIDGDGRDKVREALDALDTLEAQLEAIGAGGVQALSAAPAIAKLRHLYQNMVNGAVRDTASAKRIAEGLLAPAIEALERATPPAEQQATKETSGGFHVWRDISTAPKDGSRFVATGHNYGLYSEVRHTCVAQWFRGCWMEASDWNEASELKYLTHWLPLPSPPDDVAELNDLDVSVSPQQAAPKAAAGEQHLTRQDDALCAYLADCDDNAITPDVGGAFAWAWAYASVAAPQPAPAPLSDDAKDAARYRWLREGNDAKHGAAWHVAVNLYGCEWDAAIDAALAAQGATP